MNTSFKKSFVLSLVGLILIFSMVSVLSVEALNSIVHVPLSLPAQWSNGDLNDIWGSSASDIYAVGENFNATGPEIPLLFHKSGTVWTATGLSLPLGLQSGSLSSVWGSGESNVYTVGYGCDAKLCFPLIYHTTDGTHWTKSTLPLPAERVEGYLRDVWGPDASNVYVIGRSNDPSYNSKPLLYHNTGAGWIESSPSLPVELEKVDLIEIWGSSNNDIYIVGSGYDDKWNVMPMLYHNNGMGWVKMEVSLPGGFTMGGLSGVWGSSANDVYAVGIGHDANQNSRPFVYHKDNIGWTETALPIPAGLLGIRSVSIWGSNASDVYIVGDGFDENDHYVPVMYHYNGLSWIESKLFLPTGFDDGFLSAVWGSNANNIFIAGFGFGGNYEKPLLYQKTLSGDAKVISGNTGVAGVTITYTGGSTTADASGNYSFTVLSGWSGTVMPSKTNYTFSPANRTYSNVTSNQVAQNYTATLIQRTISGNAGAAGVTLSYVNGTPKTVVSQADGSYSFHVPQGWSGTVTPSKSGYKFSPVNRTYTNVAADQTVQDYAAIPLYSISGNTGVGGVTLSYVNVTPKAVISQADGSYSFQVPSGWSGTVTPSKSGYIFLPASFTYTNVSSDELDMNYTAIPLYSISGNVGMSGATLSYTDGMSKTVTSQADGNYSLLVPEGWSGTVTPSHSCFLFDPIERSYSDVTSDMPSQDYTPSFDPGAGCADVDISIAGIGQGRFGLLAGTSTRASFIGVNNGPVKIVSTNKTSIIAAERLVYKVNNTATSFTEMMGLPNGQLDTIYWLPWYNNKDFDTQLRFANVSDQTATVHVYIGGTEMPGSPFTLLAGESLRKSFIGVNNGPVQIKSDHGVPIVAAERLVYKVNGVNTSFSEMMALPNNQLDTTYWLPWYNNKDLDTQLRFANVSDKTATVHVFIGGIEVTPVNGITLLAGQSTRVSYAGLSNGPVQIVSDQNLVAAERVIYKVNNAATSLTEMMALPNNQLDKMYWLPWYNNKDIDTQLRFANISNATATVHVYIGGVEMSGSPFTLLAGESTRQSFAGVSNGPVQIISDQNLVAAERVVYKVDNIPTSFAEMMALPNSQLDTTYWLPWYNNKDIDTQLRFGTP